MCSTMLPPRGISLGGRSTDVFRPRSSSGPHHLLPGGGVGFTAARGYLHASVIARSNDGRGGESPRASSHDDDADRAFRDGLRLVQGLAPGSGSVHAPPLRAGGDDDGDGGSGSLVEGALLLARAVELGHSLAKLWLGMCLLGGIGAHEALPSLSSSLAANRPPDGKDPMDYTPSQRTRLQNQIDLGNAEAISLIQQASDEGVALASFTLAEMYIPGSFPIQAGNDPMRALGLYQLGAEQGSTMCRVKHAYMRYRLWDDESVAHMLSGTPQADEDAATAELRSVTQQSSVPDGTTHAEHNQAVAQAHFFLGVMQSSPISSSDNKINFPSAVMHFKRASELNHQDATTNLAIMCYNGTGVPRDVDEAIRLLRGTCDAHPDDPKALHTLGTILRKEGGEEEAFRVMGRAASLGHVSAMHDFAVLHHNGVGTEKDVAQAMKWYRFAAESGQVVSQVALGLLLLSDDAAQVVDESALPESCRFAEALHWVDKAASGGHAYAQNLTGALLLSAPGKIEQDVDKAHRYTLQAAEGGLPEAQIQLVQILSGGEQTCETKKALRHWLDQAEQSGHPHAYEWLAAMHNEGEWGYAQDHEKAIEYKNRAEEAKKTYKPFGWMD